MNTPTKTVHFKDKVRVRRVPSRSAISDDLKSQLWVSHEEILKQAHGCKKSFNFLKMNSMLSSKMVDGTSRLYLDGLESSEEKRKRHVRMFRAMQSVLDEQSRLWSGQDFSTAAAPMEHVKMEEQIARIYGKHAAESSDLAHERGLNQAHTLVCGREEGKAESKNTTNKVSENDSNGLQVDKRGRQNHLFDRLKGSSRRSPRPARRSPQPHHREQERRPR
ncbi:unnamed protein product [Cylindrotheca closterium]|uniref:Uncharacterized protein n=1 Tax=Cylindrotheca closterium TaxID=2856 RepID=A0AAD2FVM8_9STRA|nr:unnamed protein product [Cylindrotheca closterium]